MRNIIFFTLTICILLLSACAKNVAEVKGPSPANYFEINPETPVDFLGMDSTAINALVLNYKTENKYSIDGHKNLTIWVKGTGILDTTHILVLSFVEGKVLSQVLSNVGQVDPEKEMIFAKAYSAFYDKRFGEGSYSYGNDYGFEYGKDGPGELHKEAHLKGLWNAVGHNTKRQVFMTYQNPIDSGYIIVQLRNPQLPNANSYTLYVILSLTGYADNVANNVTKGKQISTGISNRSIINYQAVNPL